MNVLENNKKIALSDFVEILNTNMIAKYFKMFWYLKLKLKLSNKVCKNVFKCKNK